MAITTQVVVVGNLVRDPELRYTAQAKAVVNLTIASTPRSFNQATKEWKDGEPLFIKASAWDEMAENIAGSLAKGSRVVAVGVMKSSTYKDKDGNDRTSMELQIDEVGPSLKYHTAQPVKRGKASPANKGPSSGVDADGWKTVEDGDEVPW